MHQPVRWSVLVSGLLLCAVAQAQADEELSVRHACVACHEVDVPRVGPPFAVVAARYSNADAEELQQLALRIINGSDGRWGKMPMPAQPLLSQEEAETFVRWIQGLEAE